MKQIVQISLIGLAIISFVPTVGTGVTARETQPCGVIPNGVSVASRLGDVPPPLAQALMEHVGEIVPVGAPFDATHTISVGKFRRLNLCLESGHPVGRRN